jgi:hypothetical protein
MGSVNTLDKEINHYLPRLSSRQKQTVLTVVKTFAEEGEEEIWRDKKFLAKLDSRTSDYESGTIKPLSLNELEDSARKSYKAKSGKRK